MRLFPDRLGRNMTCDASKQDSLESKASSYPCQGSAQSRRQIVHVTLVSLINEAELSRIKPRPRQP